MPSDPADAQASSIVSSVVVPSKALLLITLLAALTACGKTEIDSSAIHAGNVLGKRAATLRDGGEPVTGVVVTLDSKGQRINETEYKDGFPLGRMSEWYPDGKPKLERDVRFIDRGQNGGGLETIGAHKAWCENGTLRIDQPHAADGKPTGEHKNWNCAGQLLMQASMPAGKYRRWVEVAGGEPLLAEEGTRIESGHFDGEHRMYGPDGQITLIETWKDKVQHGAYKSLRADGSIAKEGRYENGKMVGLWKESHGNSVYTYWDYDAANFTKQEYAAAFMQAAGIEMDTRPFLQPLRDFKVDADKLRYYSKEGLVDVSKKINLDTNTRYNEFKSHIWTYPYIRASRDALPVLVELGADPKAVDSYQRSRLHYCIASLYGETCAHEDIKQLLALGIDAKQADHSGATPLHLLMNLHRVRDKSSRYGQVRKATLDDLQPTLQALLDAGADPDAQNSAGMSAAMLALQGGMYDVAGALIERSRNANLADKQGRNVIHHAFLVPGLNQYQLDLTDERKAFVKLAVSKGTDPAQTVGDNISLVELSKRNGAVEFAQFLTELKP